MLTVKTPDEVQKIIRTTFRKTCDMEMIPAAEAAGRILAEPILGQEYVPGFNRSTVDGYAVRARDTFGCSEALPAILTVTGEILMGEGAGTPVGPETCKAIPTGGAVPEGADAVVMIEYTEDYGDGTVGICRPAAPGANLIYRGDDLYPGKEVLPAGRKLTAQDIGSLAAMGFSRVAVVKKPAVGIISTGDELVPVDQTPREGQIRDVNSAMLHAFCTEAGAEAIEYGIIRDSETEIGAAVDRALTECDLVLISGGSSVGTKDASCRIIEARGELLFHGIAIKPGKPTILGVSGGKAIVGLPGHPGAAFFIARLFVTQILAALQGRTLRQYPAAAILTETVGANHGRAQYTGVHLREENGRLLADPIHSKSGLISSLAGSDGYICIPRDAEGAAAGDRVQVFLYSVD